MLALAFVVGLGCGVGLAWWAFRVRLARQAEVHADASSAEAAEAAERLTELSTLTGGLAHEIRNPLSTLKVNLQLLSEVWRDADELAESDLCRRSLAKIETLGGEVDRLQDILDDFLRYIGRQELSCVRVDLNEVVDDLLVFFRPQAAARDVQVLATLDAQPLMCELDVAKFKQALLNLFVNAQQAMSEGGELMVRTSAQTAPAPGHAPNDDPSGMSRACVEVIDTGCGIPPGDLGAIFQPYFSTKREGTGLGLPTTRRIVRAHGGTIEVDAEPGRGTRFVIRLPLADAERMAS